MNINAILQQTGLTGNETKVYLAILDLGSALAGEITKRSGINRTNVYDALDRLIEKGMASYVIQANRKYFEATPPEQILSYLEEQQTEIENKKQNINSIIPELAARRKLGKEPHEATVYKGKRGIKSVAEDVLRTKKEMFVYGAEGSFVKLFTHYAKQWHMRRGKLNIPLKIIFREELRKKPNFLKQKSDLTNICMTPLLQLGFGVIKWQLLSGLINP